VDYVGSSLWILSPIKSTVKFAVGKGHDLVCVIQLEVLATV